MKRSLTAKGLIVGRPMFGRDAHAILTWIIDGPEQSEIFLKASIKPLSVSVRIDWL